MGDAAGIGAEIIVKALTKKKVYDACNPLVIGDSNVLKDALNVAKAQLRFNLINQVNEAKFQYGLVDLIDLENINFKDLTMGRPQAMAGKASVEYVTKAVELALKKDIDAITTAPLNKKSINMAGYDYAGHTEILANLTKTKDYAMMLSTGNFRVIHVSTHTSMRKACDLAKKERILKIIYLAHVAMCDLGIRDASIAVAGLNAHAGEDGLFGNEELDEIIPAIKSAREKGVRVSGPYPPDTIFLRASKNEFDIVVAMYHDQGHIPIKMAGFERGVNVTLGLPIIRTSVDHGTAYGRAGLKLGTADPTSLIEALKLAAQMVIGKKQ
jgi:4-hydroxythreonine-4-phosphate dehydrogenase